MNPIFKEHFGVLITNDYCRSRRLLIPMISFGVISVLEARGGKRSEMSYAVFSEKS
jgi:hypothetical protein